MHRIVMLYAGLHLAQRTRVLNRLDRVLAFSKALRAHHIQHRLDPLPQPFGSFLLFRQDRRGTHHHFGLVHVVDRYAANLGKGVIRRVSIHF